MEQLLGYVEDFKGLTILGEGSDLFISSFRHAGQLISASPLGHALSTLENRTLDFLISQRPTLPEELQAFQETYHYPWTTKDLDLPLMNPFHVVLICLAYLLVVYGGMAFMKGRKEWNLKAYGILHNLVLTAISLFMCLEIIRQALILGYSFAGNTGLKNSSEIGMTKILWVFYVSKIFEMGDTVMMVLKKNFYQISFLHVYHHVTIFLIWWFIIYAYPCGDSYFSASQNSFVHVVMYSYYFMSTLKIPVPWKRFITYVQMLQFVMNVVQASYYLFYLKKEPALPMQILLIYCISLLILFYNYLVQSQKKARQATANGKGAKENGTKGKKH